MNKDTQSWSNSNLTEMEELLQKVQQLERENAVLRSLLREAIREHVDPYDLPEGDHYIARVEAALGEAKP